MKNEQQNIFKSLIIPSSIKMIVHKLSKNQTYYSANVQKLPAALAAIISPNNIPENNNSK